MKFKTLSAYISTYKTYLHILAGYRRQNSLTLFSNILNLAVHVELLGMKATNVN